MPSPRFFISSTTGARAGYFVNPGASSPQETGLWLPIIAPSLTDPNAFSSFNSSSSFRSVRQPGSPLLHIASTLCTFLKTFCIPTNVFSRERLRRYIQVWLSGFPCSDFFPMVIDASALRSEKIALSK